MKIVRNIIIILLICLVGMVLFAFIFYNYMPSKKVVAETTEYKTSNEVKELLSDEIDQDNREVVKTFEVTSGDLRTYQYQNKFTPGKANPFEFPPENTTGDVNDTDGGNSSGEGNSSNNEMKNIIGNNTTKNFYNEKVTK